MSISTFSLPIFQCVWLGQDVDAQGGAVKAKALNINCLVSYVQVFGEP